VAQGRRRGGAWGCAGVAQGLRRGCAGVAQVWRRCGAGVTSTQQPTAIKTATTTTTATVPNKRPDRRQRNQAHGQTRRPGRGRWCSIASPPAPCVLCLAERRRLAVAGMSPRRNRPPPALRTPSVPFIKPHRATAGRRASFAALRNAMSVIGTVSSDHRFRPARAIASAIRELRFGTREHFPQEHRSARERRPLKAPGAHSSQRAGSTTSLPPPTRPPKPLRSQFRNL
jgi:hypothetical protein